MQKKIVFLVFLSAITGNAWAGDIEPGLWELKMTSSAPASPDFMPPPDTMNQCFTEQDAKDPSRILGSVANPGATDCSYTDKDYSGDTFRFSMQCNGTMGIQTHGEVTFSATAMQGNLTTTASMNGQNVELQSRISAHRVGDCTQ